MLWNSSYYNTAIEFRRQGEDRSVPDGVKNENRRKGVSASKSGSGIRVSDTNNAVCQWALVMLIIDFETFTSV